MQLHKPKLLKMCYVYKYQPNNLQAIGIGKVLSNNKKRSCC